MKTLLSLAAFAAASLSAPAFAEAPAARIVVHYADLDLSSAVGRTTLDRRIGAAVRDACGSASDADLHGKNLVTRCRVETGRAVQRERAAALATARSHSGDRIASGR